MTTTKKRPGPKRKPGPKKASVNELKGKIKSQLEEIEKLKSEIDLLNTQIVVSDDNVDISTFPTDVCPVIKENIIKPFTHSGFAVRLSESGQYLLDIINYDPNNSNVKTSNLCKGGQRAHAEYEIKKMLAHGKIVPAIKRI